jgi:hypothetical protein
MLDDVTVIVPVGAGENDWRSLLQDLECLSPAAELLLVGVDPEPIDFRQHVDSQLLCATRWLQAASGRARQLNFGAENSQRSFLWFLHADSRVYANALKRLDQVLRERPFAIHYFSLAYQPDWLPIMRLNALGANFRSRWLSLPFGDQGLCLSKDVFLSLGRFDEAACYGEDHLFIWKAHENGVPVIPIRAQITTSARKYQRHGWLRTTALHVWRTIHQATPQLIRLLVHKKSS